MALELFDESVDESARGALRAEARALWDVAGGSRAAAKSFWIGKDEAPRCALERFAQEVGAFHAARRDGLDYLGVELWVQLRLASDALAERGLEFHFDKDENALQMWDVWAHPEVATATYLGDGSGAPLVVFATASETAEDEEEEEAAAAAAAAADAAPTPSRGWLCFPRRGRHVVFDGNLLHGVPSELLDLQSADAAAAAAGAADAAKGRTAQAAAGGKRSRGEGEEGGGAGEERASKKRRTAAECKAAAVVIAPPQPQLKLRCKGERISILVNIWSSHCPEGVERLKDGALGKVKGKGGTGAAAAAAKEDGVAAESLFAPGAAATLRCVRMAEVKRVHTLTEHLDGDTGGIPIEALGELRECAAAERDGRGGHGGSAMEIVYS